MTKELNALRLRVMKVGLDRGGNRKYPTELRDELQAALDQWLREGGAVAEFSRVVGVHIGTLHSWRETKERGGKPKLRAVAVKGAPAPRKASAPKPSLVLRFPNGAVIEGLTLSQIAELLR